MSEVYVSIDLEMTSARPEEQAVVEIGLIKFRGNETVGAWSSLVNPGVEFPYAIQILTGIDPADLRSAPRIEELAAEITEFIGSLPLIAHSVASDINALARNGISLNNPTIDTFELASVLLPQMSSYGLAALAAHFGIAFPKQHRAVADALVTRDLFLRLLEVAEAQDQLILDEAVRLVSGSGWTLEQLFTNLAARKRSSSTGASIWQRAAAGAGFESLVLGLISATRRDEPPLEPTEVCQPIDIELLKSLFDSTGTVANEVADYESRPSQVQMLEAVGGALNNEGQLLIEAGTGTGKSLAYLLPAAEFATQNLERVVVSTNTINLQDQLFFKDIPLVRRIIQGDLRVSLLKGRNNYLCLHRWRLMRRRQDLSLAERVALVKIMIWLLQTETGDLAELNLSDGEQSVLPNLWASGEHCNADVCEYFRDGVCYLIRARRQAEAAHLVLVNHALLLSDVLTDSSLIPAYHYLIVDEAHHLENRATDQFGWSISVRAFDSVLDSISSGGERRTGLLVNLPNVLRAVGAGAPVQTDVRGLVRSATVAVEAIRLASRRLFSALAQILSEQEAGRGFAPRMRVTPAVRGGSAWAVIERQCDEVSDSVDEACQRMATVQTALSQMARQDHLPAVELVYNELTSTLASLAASREQFNEFICESSEERIYWLSFDVAGNVVLHAAPLQVGPALESYLFAQKRAVILTSATLTIAGSFTFMKEHLGLPDADEASLPSPFNYRDSTLISVPTDIAEPERPNYQRDLHSTLVRLAISTGGRMLVLFTSHSQLRRTYHAISDQLAAKEILVLGHGVDGSSRRHLLQSFRTNERVVLLGAASFWEGIDVVGEALSVLVIVRLPFPVPNDPVFAARSELCDDPFHEYGLPLTILRFRQGFGRLIRSSTDRGAFVVLDRRIQTRSYGRQFLESLPSSTIRIAPLSNLVPTVQRWLARPPTMKQGARRQFDEGGQANTPETGVDS